MRLPYSSQSALPTTCLSPTFLPFILRFLVIWTPVGGRISRVCYISPASSSQQSACSHFLPCMLLPQSYPHVRYVSKCSFPETVTCGYTTTHNFWIIRLVVHLPGTSQQAWRPHVLDYHRGLPKFVISCGFKSRLLTRGPRPRLPTTSSNIKITKKSRGFRIIRWSGII